MDDTFRPDPRSMPEHERPNALATFGITLSSGLPPLDALRASLPVLEACLGKGRVLRIADPGDYSASRKSLCCFPIDVEKDGLHGEMGTIAVLEVYDTDGGPAVSIDDADRSLLETAVHLTSLHCQLAACRNELQKHETVVRDAQLATELQRSLQPGSDPDTMPIWGVNRPVRQVSGDFFDFYWSEKGHYAFALGDVSGKGMGAALLMAKTISLFRCLSKRIDTPAALLTAINAELRETATRGMFVSMVTGQYDPARGIVRFANAGHEPPLVRHRNRSYDTYPADAPPLGILDDLAPDDEEIDLDGGEFYVFSDGLTEYRYASGEQLGVDGLIQLVEVFPGDPPARRLEALIQLLDEEAGWEARDDLTVLIIDDSWVGPAGVSQQREAVG